MRRYKKKEKKYKPTHAHTHAQEGRKRKGVVVLRETGRLAVRSCKGEECVGFEICYNVARLKASSGEERRGGEK